MELSGKRGDILDFIIGFLVLAILYYIIRTAVHERVYSALIQYDKSKIENNDND